MITVKPFRGLRPRADLAELIAGPPYDVLSSDEARRLTKENQDSFLRVNKPEVDFDPDRSVSNEDIYRQGKANLLRLIDDGKMIRDKSPCFYIYRLTWKEQSQTGLVALTSIREYHEGKIKKHEHTRPEKVRDRADHMIALDAQVGPVFSIFRSDQTIVESISAASTIAPVYDFQTAEGVRHQFWVVNDNSLISKLSDAFDQIDHIYIADGHHRAAASAEVSRRLGEASEKSDGEASHDQFLSVLFPDDEVRILPYNRAIRGMNGLTLPQIFDRLAGSFTVSSVDRAVEPGESGRFGMYCEGNWYSLDYKAGSHKLSGPAVSIDAAILSKHVLAPVMGITDIRTDKRIDFVGGIRGTAELERLVDSGEYSIAFSLADVSVQQLLEVADAGEVMPPKSTWFEPKLRSGLFVNLLNTP